MKLARKQVVLIVGVVLVLVGVSVLLVCSSNIFEKIGSKRCTIEVEEVIANLEWGMTKEEVEQAMATKDGYSMVSAESDFILYSIVAYQGIPGANGYVALWFSDEELLTHGFYSFKVSRKGSVPEASEAVMEDLDKAFRKTYEDNSEAVCADTISDSIYIDPMYYKGERSLVHICGNAPSSIFIYFDDVEERQTAALIQELDWKE